MDALREEVGRQQAPIAASRRDDRGIVPHAEDNPTIGRTVTLLESPDQLEFSETGAGLRPV
jgi:hypothetical protein